MPISSKKYVDIYFKFLKSLHKMWPFFQKDRIIIYLKGSEKVVLYADILFAINFSMDFLALFICSLLLHTKTGRIRIVLSAILGALFGVIEVILSLNQFWSFILSLIVSFVMCKIAYKYCKGKRLFSIYLMFWAISAGLGGIMSLTYTFLNNIFQDVILKYSPSGVYNGARFLLIASITAIVSIVFSKIFASKKDVKSAHISITLDSVKYSMEALCDTGNMLTDPILSKPVILVSEKSKLGEKILKKDDIRKRIIPYKDVSGGGILKGVVPESVFVENNLVDAIIAPIDTNDFAGYDALVPAKLL